jgi:hypothetical protein
MEHTGGATGDGGVDGKWRVSLDVDGVVSDMAAVWKVVSDKMARLRRFWGEQGCMGGEQGHSDGSGSMSHRFELWPVV